VADILVTIGWDGWARRLGMEEKLCGIVSFEGGGPSWDITRIVDIFYICIYVYPGEYDQKT
jgi:hypothetical protein